MQADARLLAVNKLLICLSVAQHALLAGFDTLPQSQMVIVSATLEQCLGDVFAAMAGSTCGILSA
jgi:hypothetical protein